MPRERSRYVRKTPTRRPSGGSNAARTASLAGSSRQYQAAARPGARSFTYRLQRSAPRSSGGGGGGSRGGGGGGGGRGYGGGGGGGGYSAAQARAEEEARKAKMRALVEQYYRQGLGSLNTGRASALPVLAKARADAIRQMQGIHNQNVAATGTTTKDIQGIQANTLNALAARYAALQRDLGSQGADTAGLQAALGDYQGDAKATGAAQDTFNKRLGQVMQTSYGDERSGVELVKQSAAGQLQANYAQALAALQNARIQSLMGLV